MAIHTNLDSLFTDIANELREKKGTTEPIVADNFPTEIHNLPTGSDTTLVDEMQMIDLSIAGKFPLRPFSEKDYTETEVEKLQNLIDKLGVS